MQNDTYHKLLQTTVENILLHLYFKANASKAYLTEIQRNKIIIDFVKPMIKQPRYALIKKKLKTITLMKNKFGSIEKHLLKILNDYGHICSHNDVDKLYKLLSIFEEQYGINSKLLEETPNKEETDLIYLDRQHIDHCFDDKNKQVAPISLFIHTQNLEPFLKCLNEQLLFKFSLFQASDKFNNYHYQLHPIQS
ncbi:DUF2913 family protein [Photobacterium damselae subsp. piscicida]|uniref:DUF2913 family protein n=1 Tax=Photobacterium damsela subsp. piscicida TaxID=38294 RepID=A0A7L8A0G9_PHODP|nr:DUF2913 family protein [Photobacterium damselae]QOD51722.1 DUF2913 family protein [Photobacterium damselae subsp. piscicida]QOD55576.1 DUF2913 family protein [Photobacterium damselae subsp. piscicida]